MTFALLDIFTSPHWDTRKLTIEEIEDSGSMNLIRTETVTDARTAAIVACSDGDSRLERRIRDELDRNNVYKSWRAAMPSRAPEAIAKYQKKYKHCDLSAANNDVLTHGDVLSMGQRLFHGGFWRAGQSPCVTTRLFSTSLSPYVAFQNALEGGKAHAAGRLDLMVLRVVTPKAKAYVFRPRGSKLGHEYEVLLSSGLCFTLQSDICVRSDFSAGSTSGSKEIPVHVLEIDVS